MTALILSLIALPILVLGYAYLGYPLALSLLAARRAAVPRRSDPPDWPSITITIPAYNEEQSIRATIEAILALDYPVERRQILIISDASTDRTDAIVEEFADRGVELLRMPQRGGKSAAENAAGRVARGDIIVNTDATTRILPASLKELVRAFQDPTVGVATGRNVSVGDASTAANRGESWYVVYEMWVRSLETRLGSIVGASGCFFGVRRVVHDTNFPGHLSRDFASCLIARERGYRSVSIDEAVCLVPRTPRLIVEFRRKIRTMTRGLETLWYKRALMNPLRYGGFSIMLISHKLCRWLVYPVLPLAAAGLVMAAVTWPAARVVLGVALAVVALGVVGIRWPDDRPVPALFAIPGFAVAANLAGLLAWRRAMGGQRSATWEPTRRTA